MPFILLGCVKVDLELELELNLNPTRHSIVKFLYNGNSPVWMPRQAFAFVGVKQQVLESHKYV